MDKASVKSSEEKAEMYRRQLGGSNKALNIERQRVKDLKIENESLKSTIIDLNTKIDRLVRIIQSYEEIRA